MPGESSVLSENRQPFALYPPFWGKSLSKGGRRGGLGSFMLRQAQHERACLPVAKSESSFSRTNYCDAR